MKREKRTIKPKYCIYLFGRWKHHSIGNGAWKQFYPFLFKMNNKCTSFSLASIFCISQFYRFIYSVKEWEREGEDKHKIWVIPILNRWYQYGTFCVKIKTFFLCRMIEECNLSPISNYILFSSSTYFRHCVVRMSSFLLCCSWSLSPSLCLRHKIILSTVINCSFFIFDISLIS